MRSEIEALGLWPTEPHPSTGEPFVECVAFDQRTDHQTLRSLRPSKPDREVYTYEDDCPVYVRDLTDEEYAAAIASWEKADAEWKRTNGMFVTRGQTHTSGTFKTASGATASGECAGTHWRWTSTYSPARA